MAGANKPPARVSQGQSVIGRFIRPYVGVSAAGYTRFARLSTEMGHTRISLSGFPDSVNRKIGQSETATVAGPDLLAHTGYSEHIMRRLSRSVVVVFDLKLKTKAQVKEWRLNG